MTENIDYGTYTGFIGDQDNDALVELNCFENSLANCDTYGAIYQWAEAMALPFSCNSTLIGTAPCLLVSQHQGICPEGWHIPFADDWAVLENLADEANGEPVDNAGLSLKSTSGWLGSAGNGADPYGFAALPMGSYPIGARGGSWSSLGTQASWWVASAPSDYLDQSTFAGSRVLAENANALMESAGLRLDGFAVRCLKNE
jgi:uncharacterized protein (TIGR02145 family)